LVVNKNQIKGEQRRNPAREKGDILSSAARGEKGETNRGATVLDSIRAVRISAHSKRGTPSKTSPEKKSGARGGEERLIDPGNGINRIITFPG